MAKQRQYRKRSSKSKTKKSTRPKGVFRKKVISVINSFAEDKHLYTSNSESTLTQFNSGINSTADMLQILPNCTEAVGESSRIGDEIRLKSFNVKGYLRVIPALGGQSGSQILQVGVRMMILSLKKSTSWDLVQSSSAPLSNLLRVGASTKGFTGLISDLQAQVNTDLFTVHSNKVYYCTQTFSNVGTTSAGYWETDIQNQIRFFNINLKVKDKKLMYDDDTNSGLLPTNYAPFLVMGYSYLNGATPDTLATSVGLHFQSHVSFQDL